MDYFDKSVLRAAFTTRQGLDDAPRWSSVQKAIQQIAAVQIDTISVVARSHHLTLRNRVKNYHPDHIWDALRNRQVFEHFAHACCFVPIEEYPYYRYRMKRFPINNWEKSQLHKYKDHMYSVEARIRNEGPLSSKDFEDPSEKKRGGFWDWKPAKQALDLLWQTGRLAVTERKNFQRVYDLSERVIPSKYFEGHVDKDQVWRYFMERNLDCLVASTARGLCEYITCGNFALDMIGNRTKTMERHLDILEQEDVVTKISVLNAKSQYYVLTRHLPFLHKVQDRRDLASCAWFLNPFDNVLWNRARVERLFNMKIKLEAYTPPANRKFGYYVTPILWQHNLIGRIDPKADRPTGTLILHNVEIDIPRKIISKTIEPIKQELVRFMRFHDLDRIQIERAKPAQLKTKLAS